MRLITYVSERGPRAGLISGSNAFDAWDALGLPAGNRGATVRRLIETDRLAELRGLGIENGKPLGHVALLPPVPDPDKIICIGLNYKSHAAEAGLEPPASPTMFAKFRNSLNAPGATVQLPAASDKVDYEAEVAFVVGRRAKEVAADDALDYIAGYMLLNDLSARDLQLATPQWMPGKIFDGAAPCGPALVTPDQAGAHDAIEFRLTLNGEQMQASSTADLIFSIPALLAELSRLTTLEPGDVVSTGTPAGVGSVREPRVWLQDGDALVVSSPTLGELATKIARSG